MTKRGVSSVIPTIYDVSGHIEPYILKGKAILSKIWAFEQPIIEKDEVNTKSDEATLLTTHTKEKDETQNSVIYEHVDQPETQKENSSGGEQSLENENFGRQETLESLNQVQVAKNNRRKKKTTKNSQ